MITVSITSINLQPSGKYNSLSGLSNILLPKHLHTAFFGNINLNAMP